MEDRFGHRISYLRVSITDRCNERCTYCMPRELQEWLPREDILTFEETLRLIRIAAELGVSKVRVTGGEPLTRRDVLVSCSKLSRDSRGIDDIGLSTNGTLLARETCTGAGRWPQRCARPAFDSVNISLDTLDREFYAQITGRDFLPQVLAGIEARDRRGFRANQVELRSDARSERRPVHPVGRICGGARNLLLRFIELMPVSTSDVLTKTIFCRSPKRSGRSKHAIGALIPEPAFRTNGPATYYQIPGRDQRVGFIGAMTNLHFCESCNKLRLTCDGKLRPCLGSYLEFDIMKVMRAGRDDAELEAVLPRCGRAQTGAARFPGELSAGAQDGGDRRLRMNRLYRTLAADGSAQMVDVSAKPMSAREAIAAGRIQLRQETLDLIAQERDRERQRFRDCADRRNPGGEANVAADSALSQPCSLAMSKIEIVAVWTAAEVTCTARTVAQTGVEMEALTGVAVALLTIYDMCKAVDKEMEIADSVGEENEERSGRPRMNAMSSRATQTRGTSQAPTRFRASRCDLVGFRDLSQLTQVTRPVPRRLHRLGMTTASRCLMS